MSSSQPAPRPTDISVKQLLLHMHFFNTAMQAWRKTAACMHLSMINSSAVVGRQHIRCEVDVARHLAHWSEGDGIYHSLPGARNLTVHCSQQHGDHTLPHFTDGSLVSNSRELHRLQGGRGQQQVPCTYKSCRTCSSCCNARSSSPVTRRSGWSDSRRPACSHSNWTDVQSDREDHLAQDTASK
jgi:hypothetical protein